MDHVLNYSRFGFANKSYFPKVCIIFSIVAWNYSLESLLSPFLSISLTISWASSSEGWLNPISSAMIFKTKLTSLGYMNPDRFSSTFLKISETNLLSSSWLVTKCLTLGRLVDIQWQILNLFYYRSIEVNIFIDDIYI